LAHKYINFTQISLVRCKLLRVNKHSKVRTDVANLVRGFVHCFFLNVAGSIAKFEVFRTVTMKIIVCWDVSPCSL